MGAHAGPEGPTRGRAGRHRRTGQPLIERREHAAEKPARRLSLPSPAPSALVGIAVLVLIGLGAIHLSGAGSAVPLETEATVEADHEGDDEGAMQEGDSTDTADSSDATAEESPKEPGPAPAVSASPTAAETRPAELVVHVSGAVGTPGVVHLPAGSRIDDALQAAGGATQDADVSAVNLARPLADGEQIHVPVPGEEPPVAAGAAADPPDPAGASGAAGSDGGGAIDVNTASATDLEELSGVGPAIAQRILDHREKNGPFQSVDDLLEVSGIGPATLEKIRDQATVSL